MAHRALKGKTERNSCKVFLFLLKYKNKIVTRKCIIVCLPVVKEEVLGLLVQFSPLAVMLKVYGWPQCRLASVQLLTEVLQLVTCPFLPFAVSW